MSDEDNDAVRKARRQLEEYRQQVRPLVDQLHASATQTYRAAAKLARDPVTPENEGFWQITGNLFTAADKQLNPAGPEIAALVDLSQSLRVTSSFIDWSSTWAICDRLFDSLDGGEELGLSDDFLDADWTDPASRLATLIKGAQFHRVPKSYQTAVAIVVERIMLATPDIWLYEGRTLPQPWANCMTTVVFALAERLKAGNLRPGEGCTRIQSYR